MSSEDGLDLHRFERVREVGQSEVEGTSTKCVEDRAAKYGVLKTVSIYFCYHCCKRSLKEETNLRIASANEEMAEYFAFITVYGRLPLQSDGRIGPHQIVDEVVIVTLDDGLVDL